MDSEEAYKTYGGEYPEVADHPRVGSKLPLSPQEKTIAELHDVISQLTDRLKPILTPVPQSDRTMPGEDKATPVQSPLAEQLDANNYGIRKASSKIRDLMERLEC